MTGGFMCLEDRISEITRTAVRSRTGEVFDPKTNKWTETASLSDMRSDCAAEVFENQIYVSGGFNGDMILASVEVYNPIGNVFSRTVDLPYPITGHCLLNHGNQLLIVGGFDGAERQNKIWMWHRTGEWQQRPEKLIYGRSTSAACSYKGWLFSVAGYTEKVEATCEILLPEPNASRFSFIPDVPRAKSALNVLVAPNWRNFLERRGTINEQSMEMDDDYEDDAGASYMSINN